MMIDLMSLPLVALFWMGISWALGIGFLWMAISNRKIKKTLDSLVTLSEGVKIAEETINSIDETLQEYSQLFDNVKVSVEKLYGSLDRYQNYLDNNEDLRKESKDFLEQNKNLKNDIDTLNHQLQLLAEIIKHAASINKFGEPKFGRRREDQIKEDDGLDNETEEALQTILKSLQRKNRGIDNY